MLYYKFKPYLNHVQPVNCQPEVSLRLTAQVCATSPALWPRKSLENTIALSDALKKNTVIKSQPQWVFVDGNFCLPNIPQMVVLTRNAFNWIEWDHAKWLRSMWNGNLSIPGCETETRKSLKVFSNRYQKVDLCIPPFRGIWFYGNARSLMVVLRLGAMGAMGSQHISISTGWFNTLQLYNGS